MDSSEVYLTVVLVLWVFRECKFKDHKRTIKKNWLGQIIMSGTESFLNVRKEMERLSLGTFFFS